MAKSATLTVDAYGKSTIFSSFGGVCKVSGPGGVSIGGGSFICEGHLSIGSGTLMLLSL